MILDIIEIDRQAAHAEIVARSPYSQQLPSTLIDSVYTSLKMFPMTPVKPSRAVLQIGDVVAGENG